MVPRIIQNTEFAKRVFIESEDPVNLWKQKRNQTGKNRITDSDKQKIKRELLKIAAELIEFADTIV